ncbi:MAG: AzlC family ABC transporter permease [Lachnospiraceae bacterium]|nr:AzlC family ABC transporter permease [Lachnospiraceae bacterium]
MKSIKRKENRTWFLKGMRHGVPIGLGYFAVAFTLGIQAKSIGMTPLQSALMSFTMHASAGEFAAMTVIAAGSGYVEMAITQLVINLRYLLMSCALSQKVSEKMPFIHRFFISYYITDEIFGISSTVDGKLNPRYTYGAALVASPGWVLGTYLGAVVGNILPDNVSSAMSVALYGMFLAIIIPPARKHKVIAVIVVVSMLASYGFTVLAQAVSEYITISSGMRILILTVLIAGIAAVVRPIEESEGSANEG